MKAIVFTLKGEFARFRLSYTTTSALSYSVIHPIAVRGLIGAIMGIDYNELYKYTKNMKIAIQVLNPVLKDTQSFNLIPQTGSNGAANFQSRVEFLRNVKYRIFLMDKEEKLNSIEEVMKSRKFQFTPYLGASEHIAKVDYEGIYNCESLEKGSLSDTLILREELDEIKDYKAIYFDRIPVENSQIREYTKYEKVAFTVGEKIKTKNIQLYKVGNFNVYFL